MSETVQDSVFQTLLIIIEQKVIIKTKLDFYHFFSQILSPSRKINPTTAEIINPAAAQRAGEF